MKTLREMMDVVSEGIGSNIAKKLDARAIKQAIDALYMAPHSADFSDEEYNKIVEVLDILRSKIQTNEDLDETTEDPIKKVESLFKDR